MAASDKIQWPLGLPIAPIVNNDAVNFSYRSSDPQVVCDFSNLVDDADPIDVATKYVAIRANPTAAASNSTYPMANQGGTYLNLFYTDNATLAGGAKVRAFGGHIIKNQNQAGRRFWPNDWDVAELDPYNDSAICPPGLAGIVWFPLYHPVTGDHMQTFPTSVAEVKALGAAGNTHMLGGVTYFTRGADIIIVLPVAVDGGTSTNPCCVGILGC